MAERERGGGRSTLSQKGMVGALKPYLDISQVTHPLHMPPFAACLYPVFAQGSMAPYGAGVGGGC